MVEPLSWKTTTARGFLFNLAVKFERTYGPDPVQLCLVIRDTMVHTRAVDVCACACARCGVCFC